MEVIASVPLLLFLSLLIDPTDAHFTRPSHHLTRPSHHLTRPTHLTLLGLLLLLGVRLDVELTEEHQHVSHDEHLRPRQNFGAVPVVDDEARVREHDGEL